MARRRSTHKQVTPRLRLGVPAPWADAWPRRSTAKQQNHRRPCSGLPMPIRRGSQPRPLKTEVRPVRLSRDSDSATMASTLNSSRPTGSVGSYTDPPRLRRTCRTVSSSAMALASGSDRASRSSLVTTNVSPSRQAARASRRPGRSLFARVYRTLALRGDGESSKRRLWCSRARRFVLPEVRTGNHRHDEVGAQESVPDVVLLARGLDAGVAAA